MGRLREPRTRETIGFDSCIRKGVSDASTRYLTEEQAITLQTINGLQDAAQHHLIVLPKQKLYIHAQSGVTPWIGNERPSRFGRETFYKKVIE